MPLTKKTRSQPRDSSAFSKFIRKAPSGEKKRIYSKVIQKSIEDQKKILESAAD